MDHNMVFFTLKNCVLSHLWISDREVVIENENVPHEILLVLTSVKCMTAIKKFYIYSSSFFFFSIQHANIWFMQNFSLYCCIAVYYSVLQALIFERFNLAAVNFAIIFSSTTLPLSPPLSAPETWRRTKHITDF